MTKNVYVNASTQHSNKSNICYMRFVATVSYHFFEYCLLTIVLLKI